MHAVGLGDTSYINLERSCRQATFVPSSSRKRSTFKKREGERETKNVEKKIRLRRRKEKKRTYERKKTKQVTRARVGGHLLRKLNPKIYFALSNS